MLSKAEVLQQADFVTLHAALTTGSVGTAKLIGEQELNVLKTGAYLVNCARRITKKEPSHEEQAHHPDEM